MVPAHEVVITGLGVVSPIGLGREAFWQSLLAGRSGVTQLEEFAVGSARSPFGGAVRDFDPKLYVTPRKSLKVMSRDIQLGFAAARLALEDAVLAAGSADPERFGVVFGGDMIYCDPAELEPAYRACLATGQVDTAHWGARAFSEMYPLWMLKYLPNMPACHIAIANDARGPNNTVVLGEVSSLLAMAEAVRLIERSLADVVIAGGAGSRIHPMYWICRDEQLMSQRQDDPASALRPFDATRDGTVYGEGAAALVLESRQHATARGRTILAQVVDYASGFEPPRPGAAPTGSAIRATIRQLLDRAKLTPADIDHVNAHGLGTVAADRAEAQAIRAELGDVPVTAPKSFFGNLGAAAGAVEAVASVLALTAGQIPPTLNYRQPDPDCPVQVVHGGPGRGQRPLRAIAQSGGRRAGRRGLDRSARVAVASGFAPRRGRTPGSDAAKDGADERSAPPGRSAGTRRSRTAARWALVLRFACLLSTLAATGPHAAPGAEISAPEVVEDDSPPERPILALDTGGHTNSIYKLLTTRYGDQLISVGLDKTIRFWDLASGEPVRVLRPPIARGILGYLFTAAISPDGKLLAVAGYRALTPELDHRIHLIALPEGQIVHSLQGHPYAIFDLAFSSDGRQLASASHDGTLRIWDTATGQTTKVLAGHTAVVQAVAWSPDDKYLLSGSIDKTARIWSPASGATVAQLRPQAGEVLTVAWSPDGRSIATGGSDKSIRLFEPSGKFRYAWSNLPNEVTSVAFSPDSKRLLYTYGSNSLPPVGAAVLDMVDGHEHAHYPGHANSVLCGTFLADGKLAATGDSVSAIRLWDTSTGKTVRKLEGQGQSVISVGWSPDGQAVAWGHSTKGATVDNGGPLERTFCFGQLEFGPPPDKTFLRARPQLGELRMALGIEGGRQNRSKVGIARGGTTLSMFRLPQSYDQIRCFSLLSPARAVVGASGGVYILRTDNAQIQQQLMGRGEDIWSLAPSPDFRYLLTAGNDQIVKLWHLEKGTQLVSLFAAGNQWIAWTPQGYYAASLAGESLMGWHVNQGPDQMAAYYPASQFHKSLYRPDVIRRLLATGDAYQALDLADREQTIQTRKLVVADVLPPQIKFDEPEARRDRPGRRRSARRGDGPAGR